jgi:predicted nucleic acid-binding protein
MTRYVLDATFLIDHLRDDLGAIDRFRILMDAGDEPIVTDVAAAEIWAGWHPDREVAIEKLLRYLEFVQAGPPTSRQAGIWRAEARRRGRVLHLADALIAASAFDLDATVLTRNVRDYALTPVRVETY